jgi:hypothetical protein
MNEYDQAAKRLTGARIEKLNWESDYRNWQFNQWQNAETVWFNNLNAALDRYIQALNTELTMKQAEITKRRADTDAILASLNNSMADTLVAYHWYQQSGK